VLQSIFMSARAVLYVPQLLAVLVVVVFVVLATSSSARGWVHAAIALLLFFVVTGACVWALQLGWALAMVGLLAAVFGLVWRLVGSGPRASSAGELRAHRSGGFIWPGLGLVAAPFANIFVLMPILRQVIH
jgi:hypothetical protein